MPAEDRTKTDRQARAYGDRDRGEAIDESICNSGQPISTVPDYSPSGVDWEILARGSFDATVRGRVRNTRREPTGIRRKAATVPQAEGADRLTVTSTRRRCPATVPKVSHDRTRRAKK